MKKILSIWTIFTFILLLSGCVVANEPVFTPGDMSIRKDLIVEDISSSYDFTEDTLRTYTYEQDSNYAYINIEEFVTFLDAGFIGYDVTKEDTLLLRYVHYIEPQLRDVVGYQFKEYFIEFNHEENTIYLSDFDVVTRLNFGFSVNTNEDVELVRVDETDVDSEVTIDLDAYEFDIMYENDKYYIPLYLANLFLTGSSINLYELDESLVIFDYGSDVENVIDLYTTPVLEFINTKEVSTNYLELYFDYFYGLKEYKQIDSFSEYLDTFNLNENSDSQSYFDDLNSFIESLNDLHTQIVDYGYIFPETETNVDYSQDGKLANYSVAYRQNKCGDLDESFYYELINGIHYFTIKDFNSNTGDLFYAQAQYISQNDEVVIDIACNTGGSIQGVVETLMYLTDEDIPMRHISSRTGRVTEEFYRSTEDLTVKGNFTLITSNVSYSASNVFASIFKDLELGLVIGDQTLGGASALIYTVLPNGTILSNSSYLTFIDENYEIKEDGIEHNIDYFLPLDKEDLSQELGSIFELGVFYNFNTSFTQNRSRVEFAIITIDEDIGIGDLTLTIYDELNQVLYSAQYQDSFFDIHRFDSSIATYRVEVTVTYTYDSEEYQESIYNTVVS